MLVGVTPSAQSQVARCISLSEPEWIRNDRVIEHHTANIKYYLLPLTNPVSNDTTKFDWHTLLVAYAATLTIHSLAGKIGYGTFSADATNGQRLISVTFEDRRVKSGEVDACSDLLKNWAPF